MADMQHSNVAAVGSDMSDSDVELVKQRWTREQLELSEKVVQADAESVAKPEDITLFGGLDVSFIVDDLVNACACYVVLNRDLEVVYRDLRMVELTAPYIPSFLGFREAGVLSQLVERQVAESPELTPAVLMVDGNGLLHPRGCGTACHVALATGLPTLGVAKNLHLMEELGLGREGVKAAFRGLREAGQHLALTGKAGRVLGAALRTTRDSRNPVYVSVGSGVSLPTALDIVTATSRHRVPEPIRQADLLSREFLRIHHPSPRQVQSVRQPGRTKAQRGETQGDQMKLSDQNPSKST